jgi:DnaK suppressor protein
VGAAESLFVGGESGYGVIMGESAVSLRDVRERTAQRVAELIEVFDAIVASSDAANLDDEHDPEGATVGFERAQLSSMVERARTQLSEINAALERLRRGSYGVCERCAGQIPGERLGAQPATRTCVGCAAPARPR